MGKNGKEPENLDFSSVAATVEKASTYVFAGRLIAMRRSGVRPPSAPPKSVLLIFCQITNTLMVQSKPFYALAWI